MDEKVLNQILKEIRESRLEFRRFRDEFLSTNRDLWEKSRRRWRVSKPDSSLTWGALWTGDAFIDLVRRYYRFSNKTRILEVGPGYGRLLDSILQKRFPFESYVAVELSAACVEKLREKIPSSQGGAQD